MQIGNKIKVIDKPPSSKNGVSGRNICWVSEMDLMCGKEFSIADIFDGYISVGDNRYDGVLLANHWFIVIVCTCDIMALMARGCKCGFIERERCK